jgi:hypothetical protein
MAMVVVGGQSRDVGKTSVVAGLISALPEFQWMALKITQYGHGICSRNGRACHCATADHSWALSEETDQSGRSDSSRFLLAGAKTSLWVRTQQGRLAQAVPALRARIAAAANVICESNSILHFLDPDLYLTVLDPATADFKNSARHFLERADGLILHRQREKMASGTRPLATSAQGKPVFLISPPPYVTQDLIDFVRAALRITAVSS